MTAVAPELTGLESLDWQPACEVPQCEAGHPPATWRLIIDAGCPHPEDALICDQCAERIRAFVRTADAICCQTCGYITPNRPAEYVTLTCLGGH